MGNAECSRAVAPKIERLPHEVLSAAAAFHGDREEKCRFPDQYDGLVDEPLRTEVIHDLEDYMASKKILGPVTHSHEGARAVVAAAWDTACCGRRTQERTMRIIKGTPQPHELLRGLTNFASGAGGLTREDLTAGEASLALVAASPRRAASSRAASPAPLELPIPRWRSALQREEAAEASEGAGAAQAAEGASGPAGEDPGEGAATLAFDDWEVAADKPSLQVAQLKALSTRPCRRLEDQANEFERDDMDVDWAAFEAGGGQALLVPARCCALSRAVATEVVVPRRASPRRRKPGAAAAANEANAASDGGS